jgi:hypothetical protein
VAIEEAHLELALQDVFDRARTSEQDHYFELMRHNPSVGMAYLEALWRVQGQTWGNSLRATEDLDMEDVVPCPHCGGVLLGRWEGHQVGCPAISTEHAAANTRRQWTTSPSGGSE